MSFYWLNTLIWLLLNFVPQLLLSLIIHLPTLDEKQENECIETFPQLILSSPFTCFGFSKNREGRIFLSLKMTLANCALTFLGFTASVIMIWDTVQVFPHAHQDINIMILMGGVTLFMSLYYVILSLFLLFAKVYRKTTERRSSCLSWSLAVFPLAMALICITISISCLQKSKGNIL